MATPKPGDFGLVAISGEVGRLIRFGQWLNGDGFGQYQHAFLVLDNGELIEAEPGRDGARIRSLSEYNGTNVVFSDWPHTDDDRGRLVRAGRAREGARYSFLDYWALAAHRLHIPAPGLRRYIASTGHDICSQLVDLIHQDAKLTMFGDHRWNGYVTPMALSRALHGPVMA